MARSGLGLGRVLVQVPQFGEMCLRDAGAIALVPRPALAYTPASRQSMRDRVLPLLRRISKETLVAKMDKVADGERRCPGLSLTQELGEIERYCKVEVSALVPKATKQHGMSG